MNVPKAEEIAVLWYPKYEDTVPSREAQYSISLLLTLLTLVLVAANTYMVTKSSPINTLDSEMRTMMSPKGIQEMTNYLNLLGQRNHLSKTFEEYFAFVLGSLSFLTLLILCGGVIDFYRHSRKRKAALAEARKLISAVYLDSGFQAKRDGDMMVVTGIPKCSTPSLSGDFTEQIAIVPITAYIQLAPYLEPLRKRFEQMAP